MKKILSLALLLVSALYAESFVMTQRLLNSKIKPDFGKDDIFAAQLPEKDFFIIYQEPFFNSPFQFGSLFDDPFFNRPFNPVLPPFWDFPQPMQYQNPFGFDNTQSIMMNKLFNSFPSFYNMMPDMKPSKSDDLNIGSFNDAKKDLILDPLSCNSIRSEVNSDGDNYETNQGFLFHFESSTCNCNQTGFCKYSYTKPDLDFCYLKQIESSDSSEINNCELLDKCKDDKSCDGIYVDHRSMKYFKVYCNGDKIVPNISAKSAKQFVIQLKNC